VPILHPFRPVWDFSIAFWPPRSARSMFIVKHFADFEAGTLKSSSRHYYISCSCVLEPRLNFSLDYAASRPHTPTIPDTTSTRFPHHLVAYYTRAFDALRPLLFLVKKQTLISTIVQTTMYLDVLYGVITPSLNCVFIAQRVPSHRVLCIASIISLVFSFCEHILGVSEETFEHLSSRVPYTRSKIHKVG
jgi:hypothetical protein